MWQLVDAQLNSDTSFPANKLQRQVLWNAEWSSYSDWDWEKGGWKNVSGAMGIVLTKWPWKSKVFSRVMKNCLIKLSQNTEMIKTFYFQQYFVWLHLKAVLSRTPSCKNLLRPTNYSAVIGCHSQFYLDFQVWLGPEEHSNFVWSVPCPQLESWYLFVS